MSGYFFCESVHATSSSPWHIRPSGSRGKMLGGGADTPALCGRVMSWDIDLAVTPATVHRVEPCARCLEKWLHETFPEHA